MSNKEQQDEPEFFVSRRGRQVGIHEVDLKGIDIDSDSDSPKPDPKKNASKSVSSAKKSVAKPAQRTGSRKRKLIVISIVLLVLALPLIAAELLVAEYHSGITGAKNDLSKLISSEVLPAQKKTAISADQMRTIADKVNDISSHMCRGGFLDNSAELYPRANSAFDECKAAQRNYTALTATLYELEAQARYLEKLNTQIKPVTTPITDEYAVIGAQQEAWQAAAEGVKKLSPPEGMKNAHSELSMHVTAVADAWSKLNTANNSQDAAAFTEVEKQLSTEYEAVRSTSVQLTGVLNDTQAKLTAAYAALE